LKGVEGGTWEKVRREWRKDEINYLKECIGFQKITTIAKNLDRSYESVRLKMNRLGISNTKAQTGFVTMGELAKILKIERNTIRGWAKNHGLPCMKRVVRRSKSFYFIDPIDFWNWAEMHKEKIQFSNINSQVLLPEPEWVDHERKKERDNHIIKKKNYKYWTTGEDQRLLELRKNGLTFKEIGVRMNRSSHSVAGRYKRITYR